MAATTATKRRPRNKPAAAKDETETYLKDAVLLRRHTDGKAVLDNLFDLEGITSFEDKARALEYPSTGMLHRALKDGLACSSALIVAIRLYFPGIPYEALFTEGKVLAERKVTADAPADLAA